MPRPIGWISTVDEGGTRNLAPFSQFQNVSWDPPTVMVAVSCRPDGLMRDTAANALAAGEFVWNVATCDLREQVVATSEDFPAGVSEFNAFKIATVASEMVKARRVAASSVHFECRLKQHVFVPGNTPESNTYMLIGEVVGIHINDAFIGQDGVLDVLRLKPLARVGNLHYITVETPFRVQSPAYKAPHTAYREPATSSNESTITK